MKVIALFLITLVPLSYATRGMEEVCSIAFDKHDRAAMYSRNFIVGDSTRWPNGVVPYEISQDFSESDVSKIKDAMRVLEAGSCIRFIPHTDQKNYVGITTGSNGCYANLGFNPWRISATLHLQKDSYCMRSGTIMHEMLHVLGYAHEHTRPDRDEYLKIHWDKIPPGYASNWFRAGGVDEYPLPPVCKQDDPAQDFDNCYAGFQAETFGVPYDYGSVMHYGLRAGTQDGSNAMDALKPIPFGTFVGQRIKPSANDFKKLKKAYNCDDETEKTTEKTTKKATTTTTTKSTTKPDDCVDTFEHCESLSKYCEYFFWVKKHCKKSCGLCGDGTTKPPCRDKYTNCPQLKSWCEKDNAVEVGCGITCGTC